MYLLWIICLSKYDPPRSYVSRLVIRRLAAYTSVSWKVCALGQDATCHSETAPLWGTQASDVGKSCRQRRPVSYFFQLLPLGVEARLDSKDVKVQLDFQITLASAADHEDQTVTTWKSRSAHNPSEPSQLTEPWQIIISHCFKPLSFKMVCCVVIENQCSELIQRRHRLLVWNSPSLWMSSK